MSTPIARDDEAAWSAVAGRDLRIPEVAAEYFHNEYERIAPFYGYKTREASAVPWSEVPEANRRLMMAVCGQFLNALNEQDEAVSRKVDRADIKRETN